MESVGTNDDNWREIKPSCVSGLFPNYPSMDNLLQGYLAKLYILHVCQRVILIELIWVNIHGSTYLV